MSSGRSDEMKGRLKEVAGVLTGDAKLEREGRSDRVAGQLKRKVEKVIDRARGALDGIVPGSQER